MISSFTLFFKSACLYSSYEVKVQKIFLEIFFSVDELVKSPISRFHVIQANPGSASGTGAGIRSIQ